MDHHWLAKRGDYWLMLGGFMLAFLGRETSLISVAVLLQPMLLTRQSFKQTHFS